MRISFVPNLVKLIPHIKKLTTYVYSVAYFGSESLNSKLVDWERSMGVNVAGSAFMVQAVLQVSKEPVA